MIINDISCKQALLLSETERVVSQTLWQYQLCNIQPQETGHGAGDRRDTHNIVNYDLQVNNKLMGISIFCNHPRETPVQKTKDYISRQARGLYKSPAKPALGAHHPEDHPAHQSHCRNRITHRRCRILLDPN